MFPCLCMCCRCNHECAIKPFPISTRRSRRRERERFLQHPRNHSVATALTSSLCSREIAELQMVRVVETQAERKMQGQIEDRGWPPERIRACTRESIPPSSSQMHHRPLEKVGSIQKENGERRRNPITTRKPSFWEFDLLG